MTILEDFYEVLRHSKNYIKAYDIKLTGEGIHDCLLLVDDDVEKGMTIIKKADEKIKELERIVQYYETLFKKSDFNKNTFNDMTVVEGKLFKDVVNSEISDESYYFPCGRY